ncbi:979_t:CDS:10 [Scutellospora calospora]|uniref:979_t:CDS:1 n=1 Tax=Scutellospora calospora TaxID=85575 RepID=A0ACA9JU32_9GLOM|nr:979_t:CDS:10 [Scutellospora calospora]
MDEDGFLPTVHFRSKNSHTELPEYTSNRRSRPYSSDWQQKRKNQLYGNYPKWNKKNNNQDEEQNDDIQEYERPAKRLSLSNSTASKWSQYRKNAEDNDIGNSNLSDNNLKGQFQRSFSSFITKKFIPHNLDEYDTLSKLGDQRSFQRSLANSLLETRSVENLNPTSSIMERNTLKNVVTRKKSDLMTKIAGPIEFLPTYHNDIRALAARPELAKFDDITLNNVIKRYREKNASGSKPFEPPKAIEISKEEWDIMMRTLELSEEFSRNTIKVLKQWQDIKVKIPFTVGKIVELDLNKKVATIADYTGKIQIIIHEKVHRVHGRQFQIGTIIVLKNVAILRSIENTYLNVTVANIYLILEAERSNNLDSILPDEVLTIDLTKEPNEDVNTNINQIDITNNSDKNKNEGNSEVNESTRDNESQMKVISISNKDPENNSFMISNMEDPEDISWMLDDLEEVFEPEQLLSKSGQFVGITQEVVDEYTFTQYLGYHEAKRQLRKHWSTWVTEKDIATLASYGLNHLRIPIGYWALDKIPEEPFVKGAFQYLVKAVIWAKKYNLNVVLDLHGAPGSQNGFDNSGRRGPIGWQTSSPDNIPRTIKAIKIMIESWGGNQFNITQKFYKDSYKVIRHVNSDILIIYHTAFLPLNTWQNFLSSSEFDRVALDTHSYDVFDYSLLAQNQEQRLNFACSNKADITSNQGIWTLIGEWSLAITDCTKWLNGFGRGARYDGTYEADHGPICPSCTCKGEGDYSKWTDDYKNYLKQFASAQMDAYETGIGWIFWNFKAENSPHWDFMLGIQQGWIPLNKMEIDNNKSNVYTTSKDEQNEKLVPKFWIDKYKKEASKNWDLFYKRNTTNFFKNRNWIGREFSELSVENDPKLEQKIILELGCGVGNFVFPVLKSNPNFFIYACDFSKRAIEFVKNHEQYDNLRCHAFVCDLTTDNLKDHIPSRNVDVVSLIFVLSAIPPESHYNVIRNISEVTKKGSIICFRDYAKNDEAEIRFSNITAQHKLQENFYVRQDGTMSYFFTIEYLKQIFEQNGFFELVDGDYVARETINRAKNLCVDRKFLQARFKRL